MLILTTATFGLLLVGLLAISMTPGQGDDPVAVGSTVSGIRAIPAAALTRVSMPMVTPVGAGRMGVTTLDALGADLRRVEARLPTGEVVEGDVVATDDGLALIELPATVEEAGLTLANADLAPTDTVMVHTAEPMVISVAEIDQLQVDEGTPVTDAEGRLIGLCTGDDQMWLRTVERLPTAPPPATVDAPLASVAAAAPSSVVATTVELPPETTVAPPTTPAEAAPSTPPSSAAVPPEDEEGGDDTLLSDGDASDGPG